MDAEISKRLEDKMVDLMEQLIDLLLDRVKDGTITPSEATNAVRLLKENGITIDITDADLPDGVKDGLKDILTDDDGKPLPIPFPQQKAG